MRYYVDQILVCVACDLEVGDRLVVSEFSTLPMPNIKVADIEIRVLKCTEKHRSSLDYTISKKKIDGYVFEDKYNNVYYNQYPYATDLNVSKYANFIMKRDIYTDGVFVKSEVFIDMYVYLKAIRKSIARFRYNRKRNAKTFTPYTKKVMVHRINVYRSILNAWRAYKAKRVFANVVEEEAFV
jgi:hypothetical protein